MAGEWLAAKVTKVHRNPRYVDLFIFGNGKGGHQFAMRVGNRIRWGNNPGDWRRRQDLE